MISGRSVLALMGTRRFRRMKKKAQIFSGQAILYSAIAYVVLFLLFYILFQIFVDLDMTAEVTSVSNDLSFSSALRGVLSSPYELNGQNTTVLTALHHYAQDYDFESAEALVSEYMSAYPYWSLHVWNLESADDYTDLWAYYRSEDISFESQLTPSFSPVFALNKLHTRAVGKSTQHVVVQVPHPEEDTFSFLFFVFIVADEATSIDAARAGLSSKRQAKFLFSYPHAQLPAAHTRPFNFDDFESQEYTQDVLRVEDFSALNEQNFACFLKEADAKQALGRYVFEKNLDLLPAYEQGLRKQISTIPLRERLMSSSEVYVAMLERFDTCEVSS